MFHKAVQWEDRYNGGFIYEVHHVCVCVCVCVCGGGDCQRVNIFNTKMELGYGMHLGYIIFIHTIYLTMPVVQWYHFLTLSIYKTAVYSCHLIGKGKIQSDPNIPPPSYDSHESLQKYIPYNTVLQVTTTLNMLPQTVVYRHWNCIMV